MKQVIPNRLITGATLSSARMAANYRQIEQDVLTVNDVRYSHASVQVEWAAITHSTTDELKKRPVRFAASAEVVGLSLEIFGDDGETFTLSSDVGTLHAFSTTGKGSANVSQAGADRQALVASGDEIVFSVDSDAATWAASARLTIFYRVARPVAGFVFGEMYPATTRIAADGFSQVNRITRQLTDGDVSSGSFFASSAHSRLTGGVVAGAIVVKGPESGVTVPSTIQIPALNRDVIGVTGVANANTGTVNPTLRNAGGTTVATANITPAGATVSVYNAGGGTMGADPMDEAMDWSLEWVTTGSPTIQFSYAIIWLGAPA